MTACVDNGANSNGMCDVDCDQRLRPYVVAAPSMVTTWPVFANVPLTINGISIH